MMATVATHSASHCRSQLDPTSPVSHTETIRARRFVEIPPGVLSQIRFFLRTAEGSVVDLWGLGASISAPALQKGTRSR